MIKIKKTTIYTLAEELGMTPSMVSRAFNPTGKINEQKRQIVLKAAEKHNFIPNKMASRLSGKSIKIGIIINSVFKPIENEMVDGIKQAYKELKDYKIEYELFTPGGKSDISYEIKKLKSYDGVIVSGCGADNCTSLLSEIKNLVQVQSINEHVDYLFSSEHDMTLASDIAAEFLANCLKFSKRKNIILFTGDITGSVHSKAKKSFLEASEKNGLNVIKCIDMHDDEVLLKQSLSSVFKKNIADGVYITSGISLPLCEYFKKNNLNIPLVTFDVYKELNEYIKSGVVSATIFQNAKGQAKEAFEKLVLYIINNEIPSKKNLTSVHLVMKSNLRLYE